MHMSPSFSGNYESVSEGRALDQKSVHLNKICMKTNLEKSILQWTNVNLFPVLLFIWKCNFRKNLNFVEKKIAFRNNW